LCLISLKVNNLNCWLLLIRIGPDKKTKVYVVLFCLVENLNQMKSIRWTRTFFNLMKSSRARYWCKDRWIWFYECVCVFVREREWEIELERSSVCVCMRESEKECVCLCVWERERERVSVSAYVIVRKKCVCVCECVSLVESYSGIERRT